MMKLIPRVLDDYLPFTPESLISWNSTTDILQFLYTLYDKPAVIISHDGKRTHSNYRSYGKYVYDEGQKRVWNWIKQFEAIAKKSKLAPGAAVPAIEIPDFSADPTFGKTAKYIIAFDGVVREIMQEGAFFSIAHVMESETDLECSIILAINLYYRHSLQVLRSMLENLVLPIYFSNNEADFLAWRRNNYRMPRLRGKNGMLRKLVGRNQLSKDLANEIAGLYGELSKSIHGSESRLVHKGFYTGRWIGHVFKKPDFHRWCNCLSKLLDLAIRLLRIHIVAWEKAYENKGIICQVCLNDDFDVEKEKFGGELYVNYHCRRCGYTMTFSARER